MQPFASYATGDAGAYQRYRPGYPAKLFRAILDYVNRRELAWDVGTGNGQVALALAEWFHRVVASDQSAAQVDAATPHPRVEYRVAVAAEIDLEEASVDLVTVGQALHWFDPFSFFATVDRVLRPGGVLAAWCYLHLEVTPEVDRLVLHLYEDILGDYWDPRRKLVEEGYDQIGFPYPRDAVPPITMDVRWGVDQLLGYLGTWSAVRAYRKAEGGDPLRFVAEPIREAWGAADTRPVSWPLTLHLGRKPETADASRA